MQGKSLAINLQRTIVRAHKTTRSDWQARTNLLVQRPSTKPDTNRYTHTDSSCCAYNTISSLVVNSSRGVAGIQNHGASSGTNWAVYSGEESWNRSLWKGTDRVLPFKIGSKKGINREIARYFTITRGEISLTCYLLRAFTGRLGSIFVYGCCCCFLLLYLLVLIYLSSFSLIIVIDSMAIYNQMVSM